MDDLLADFIAEAQDMLAALAGEIVAWEQNPADRARMDAIFRFFHTIKGNCGFFDFPQLEALSHAAEDVLADVRAGRRHPDTALVDLVLAVIDQIADMIEALDQNEGIAADAGKDLIARLKGDAADPHEDGSDPAASAAISPAGKAAHPASTARRRTVRLPVDLIDQIMGGVSDMVLARNELGKRLQQIGGQSGLESAFGRLGAALDEVRDAITRTRMQSIDVLFNAYPRLVRDLSAELGKQVLVELENGDVELDRELIELIRDPLVHVIRNAIDHGIETPEERRAAGKREIGVLRISARQTGNEIRIGVIDDGRGVDSDAALARAIANGLISAEEGARLSARERNLLICQPGFSTRSEVTSVSGRGVGMDVVRANLEQIGGSLSIDSTAGAGTRILLNVPLTLSIVPALTVGVGGQKYAIPRSYVEEVVRLTGQAQRQSAVGGARLMDVRGVQVPCALLGDVLGVANPARPGALVVIRLVGGDLIGFEVDQVFDHEELVVKPLSPVIMASGFYVGNTLMDDGSPVLMLDVSGLTRKAGLIREVEHRVDPQAIDSNIERAARDRVPALLFVGMDGQRRVIPMRDVERIERLPAQAVRVAGARAQIAIQDTILPLAGLVPGADLPERLNIMLLSGSDRQLAYAFAQMIDTTAIDADLRPNGAGEDASALALIDDTPVEVLDCPLLFAAAYGRASQGRTPLCHLVGAGQGGWARDVLQPLVEAAGYRVVAGDDGLAAGEADIAIVLDDAPAELAAGSRRVIRLRSGREAEPDDADTIYRNDADALRAALLSVRMEQGR
ncbi:chemotaxis protein CheA [Altererythrobacter lauratis]|uniref:histidine kinase n=1 Tax=Alteraurantiacibacter lauratis TaxID=2054627 RepID=A0ABV7EET5_9SPHN